MIADNYRWEAERDGEVFTTGGDLLGCSRVSFVPTKAGLPRHDFIGKIFKTRFNRSFSKTPLFGWKKMLEALQGKMTKEEDAVIEAAQKVIDKHDDEYKLARQEDGSNIARHKILRDMSSSMRNRFKNIIKAIYEKYNPSSSYFMCVIYEGGRTYINCASGAALTVPEDYELYI